MRKKFVVLVVAMAVMCAMVGCSGKNTSEGNQNDTQASSTVTDATPEVTTEENGSVTPEVSNTENVNASTEANNTGVYVGADSLTDVSMGACVSGVQTPLCTVKIPTNYYIASLYMDENGKSNTMLETNGKLVSEVIAVGGLEQSSEIPATVVITAQGDVKNSYTFAIVDSATISVESEKSYAPGGVEINTDSAHPAYAYITSGQFDVVVAYEINSDWTILIENSGSLKDEKSIEEIGQEFCQLVSPIG